MAQYRMLDYIHEEPEAVARTLDGIGPKLQDLADLVAKRAPKRVVVAGFGSSYTAAQMAAPMLRRHIPVPVYVAVATEIASNPSLVLDADTLAIFVSRSGERGWLIDALDRARAGGAAFVAVTASETNLLAQRSDMVIVTAEGPEITYAKTKSMLAAAAALMSIALELDLERGNDWGKRRRSLSEAPQFLASSIKAAERTMESLGEWLAQHTNALVTGTGGNVGTAHEAALKLQEAAGIVTQWDNSGDALHGALGVLNPGWLYVGLVTASDYQLHRSLLQLVGSFHADRLCVAERGLEIDGSTTKVIQLPETGDRFVAPMFYLPPLHLLTYFAGIARGLDMDQPVFAETLLEAMLPAGRVEPDWERSRT